MRWVALALRVTGTPNSVALGYRHTLGHTVTNAGTLSATQVSLFGQRYVPIDALSSRRHSHVAIGNSPVSAGLQARTRKKVRS